MAGGCEHETGEAIHFEHRVVHGIAFNTPELALRARPWSIRAEHKLMEHIPALVSWTNTPR